MKVLIIGGNRFMGKHLSTKLVLMGNEVDVFNRSGTGISNVNIIQGDRNNREDLEEVDIVKYDCIVDMCLYKVKQFNLMKDLITKDTNYIFVSSVAVDYTEAFGEYGIEKKNLEKELSKTNWNFKIIRPTYVVGLGAHRPRLGYFINKLKNDETIELSGQENHPINLVFVQDVIKCLLKLVEDKSRTYGVYNICSDESITINELIDFIKDELGIKNHKVQDDKELPSAFDKLAMIPNQSVESDNSEIKKKYGISFTDVRVGIKEYIKEINIKRGWRGQRLGIYHNEN
tara:strand:- start:1719 stop:2579 length:861 start_codon:yes stop_codon:yes gene_type:complete